MYSTPIPERENRDPGRIALMDMAGSLGRLPHNGPPKLYGPNRTSNLKTEREVDKWIEDLLR